MFSSNIDYLLNLIKAIIGSIIIVFLLENLVKIIFSSKNKNSIFKKITLTNISCIKQKITYMLKFFFFLQDRLKVFALKKKKIK